MRATVLFALLTAFLIAETFSIPTPKTVKKGKDEDYDYDYDYNYDDDGVDGTNKSKTDSEDKSVKSKTGKATTGKEIKLVKTEIKENVDTNETKESNDSISTQPKKSENKNKTTEKNKEKETTPVDGKDKPTKSNSEKENDGDYVLEPLSDEEIYMYDDYENYPLEKELKEDGKRLVEDLEAELHLPVPARLKEVMLPESGRVMDEQDLDAGAVMGNKMNLLEGTEEDSVILPISPRLSEVAHPRSDRVMDEPYNLPRADGVMQEPAEDTAPVAERVMGGHEENTKPGGDGKGNLQLNLKALDGNPSDITVGAAAVGLMAQAVKSKGPDDNQVNAVAGFGHQIMGLVSALEKDQK